LIKAHHRLASAYARKSTLLIKLTVRCGSC
jgi:hypothetical protein